MLIKKEKSDCLCGKNKKQRISAKWKLTILYTGFLMLMAIASLAILLSVSNSQILASVKKQLESEVLEGNEYLEWDDGELEVDSDIMEVESGVYLSVYDEEGQIIYGTIPYQFTEEVPLQSGQLQTLTSNGIKWYVFDNSVDLGGYSNVYVRGITSVTKAEESFLVLIRTSFIFLPLMVVITAIIGYRFTSRTLRPVDNMIQGVQEICEKEDLSKRIPMEAGNDEIHRLAQLFNQMLEQLETAFEREKQFTSDVSHELRTPITVILSHCEYLLEQEMSEEEQKREIEVIYKKARNMAQLVSQILMISRAERDKLPIHFEEVPVSELTEMIVDEQQEIAKKKNITIQQELEEGLMAEVDETFLIRLWVNLISNAISYGKENGTVIVTLHGEGDKIRGQVKDDGIGISKENLPHIWERFYRVDQSRTSGQDSSSGLGLPMVKWIIKAHHGEIHVESEEGKGTTFSFVIPKKQQKVTDNF